MKVKYIGILLVILDVALLSGIGYLYYQQDHTAPHIKVEETTLVYEEGMEESQLLEGITAYDSVDGDVTARVVIEKIVTDIQKEKATITYGAVDSSGNISKDTRTIRMKVEEVEEPSEEESTIEEHSNESEGSTADNKPVQTDKSEQNNKQEQTAKPTQKNKSEQTTKPAQTSAQTAGSKQGPSIKFRDNRVKISVGGKPAWVNIIEGLYDDKDDYVTLFKTIKVSGNYDKSKPGKYQVQVTVTDSDGNESNAYPVEIVVE